MDACTRPIDDFYLQRAELPSVVWAPLAGALPEGSVLAALNVRPWREVWKYGERGLRYCLLDAGHAMGALVYAAGMHGWSVTALIGPSGAWLRW